MSSNPAFKLTAEQRRRSLTLRWTVLIKKI